MRRQCLDQGRWTSERRADVDDETTPCCLRHHGQWRACLKAACKQRPYQPPRHYLKEDIIKRGDTHLRHHGQWRACLKAACKQRPYQPPRHYLKEDSRFRLEPEISVSRRKLGCKNSYKTDEVQLGGREWRTKTDPG